MLTAVSVARDCGMIGPSHKVQRSLLGHMLVYIFSGYTHPWRLMVTQMGNDAIESSQDLL